MLGATAHRKIFAMLIFISVVTKYDGHKGRGEKDRGHGDDTAAAVQYLPDKGSRRSGLSS